MVRYFTDSEAETELVGASFAPSLKRGDVVALRGGLGAGKTALVRGIVSVLAPEAMVSSPTYALVNVYGGSPCIYHLDLYRLENAGDLWSIGLDDYLEGDGICLVEWSERTQIEADFTVDIEGEGDDARTITIWGAQGC